LASIAEDELNWKASGIAAIALQGGQVNIGGAQDDIALPPALFFPQIGQTDGVLETDRPDDRSYAHFWCKGHKERLGLEMG